MRILLVGGGTWQIYILRYLKKRGDYVGIINPISTTTVQEADEHIAADVKDVHKIIALVEERKYDHVISDQSDVCILPTAKIAKKLGLLGNQVSVVETFTNKYLMYQQAQKSGLPVPAYDRAWNQTDVIDFSNRHGYPIIVKPANSTSSRGFGVINSYDDIEPKVSQCLNYQTDIDYFIVQKYVTGTEVTIEGVVSGCRHKSLATSAKKHFRPGIASSLWYPASLDLHQVIAAHDSYINQSHLQFGITHAEYMIDGDLFWFIECGARGGGCGISSEIVPYVSGVHPYDVLYASLQGNNVYLESLTIEQNPAVLYFSEFSEGRVENIPSPGSIPGLHSFICNFKLQDYIKPATSDNERHSMAILFAKTTKELENNVALLQQSLNL